MDTDENSVDSLEKKSNNNSEVDSEVPISTNSVVDNLLKKFNQTKASPDESTGKVDDRAVDAKEESGGEDLLIEVDPTEFYQSSSNPNMLPTPIVENQNSSSAFVNDEDEYNEIIASHNARHYSADGYESYDESRMSPDAQPPDEIDSMVHSDLYRPRTVAEKRRLVDFNNLDYLVREQESKIFKQIERQKNKLDINYKMLDQMAYGDVPVKFGAWKVLTWLRTREGRYIQQYLEVDDGILKLPGSRGNHIEKLMPRQKSLVRKFKHQKFITTELRSSRCCAGGRIEKRTINCALNSESVRNFILNAEADARKLIEMQCPQDQFAKITPRPLSKKIEYINKIRNVSNDEDSCFLGDYVHYKMPEIKLQVVKGDKKPLPKTAKNFLGSILPHSSLSTEWCQFALSALKPDEEEEGATEKKDEDEEIVKEKKKRDSFEFKIPYKGDKESIVARELVKKRDFDDLSRLTEENSKMVWTFDKDSDKDDVLEQEIVSVIKDLTKSVFINLNEDLFTKYDTTASVEVPLPESPEKSKAAIKELSTSFSNPKSKSNKVLRELRKLNANVFKSSTEIGDVSFMRLIYLAMKLNILHCILGKLRSCTSDCSSWPRRARNSTYSHSH